MRTGGSGSVFRYRSRKRVTSPKVNDPSPGSTVPRRVAGSPSWYGQDGAWQACPRPWARVTHGCQLSLFRYMPWTKTMLAGSVTAGGYTPPGSRAGHCRGIDSGETFGPPPVA